MAALGRISGPLLKANLERLGVDLAFETDLLYLDVTNSRVGIRNSNPQYDLDVNGTARTTALEVSTLANIADISISGNTISTTNSFLNLATADTVVYQNRLRVDSIDIEQNTISTNDTNADLVLRANSTGVIYVPNNDVVVSQDLTVNGTTTLADLNSSGNITVSGNVNIAQDLTVGRTAQFENIRIDQNVISTTESNSNLELRPNGTGTVELLADTNVYGNIFASGNITADGDIVIGDQNTDNVTFNAEIASNIIPDSDNTYTLGTDSKRWANIWVNNFVADDIDTQQLVVDGVDLALRQGNIYYVAENGRDLNTGTHQNDPKRSIKAALSLASAGDTVYVYPGVYEELFPLEVPAGVTLKGWGIRSVEIRPDSTTQTEDAILLNGESTVEDLTVSNFYYDEINNKGYAFRFAPGFTVTTRSPYVRNVTVLTFGTGAGGSDFRGFNDGDAGKGAYLDGDVATAGSREASCLFHSVTFICPGVDAVTMTNGVRVEWLNSFTYFANRGLYAFDGTAGLKGSGRTAVRVSDVTGSFSQGEQFTIVAEDGSTILAQGTVDSVDPDGKFYLTGKVEGILTAEERPGLTVVANGDAQLDTSERKFGTSSLLLDGAGDYASLSAQDDFGFGTDDFTVEAWVYPTNNNTVSRIFDFRAGAINDNAIALSLHNLNPRLYVSGSYVITGSANAQQNTWNHIAYCRNGTTGTLYLNGQSIGSWTDATNYGTTKPFVIGALFNGNQSYFQGNIDELRVSTTARYSGTSLVVPQGEFTGDTNTVLLLHFNGTDGSTDFVDDGLQKQDIEFSGGATAKFVDFVDYTDFGAEVRSIASAAVYGNFGVVGDGPGVLMYLISQNLAYIGTGGSVDNDPNAVIQANEIVELNSARIRYSSVDHKGDFRVGDLFYINQETGSVEFTTAEFNVESTSGLTFTSGPNVTFIDGTTVDTGNISIHDNTVESVSGDLNLDAASGEINLLDNVNITGNLDVTGNVTVGGNITIGDADTDNLNIVAEVVSDIIPDQNSAYNLGSANKTWKTVFVNQAQIDDIEIDENYITTTASNSDLELRASGTGRVLIPSNDLEVSNNLDVNGSSTLSDTTVNGTLTVNGDISQTGNTSLSGDLTVTGTTNIQGSATFEDIQINDNTITTTESNSGLELGASGTGSIVVPNNNVELGQDLTVSGTSSLSTVTSSGTIIANTFSTGDIEIDDNKITTTNSNSNLELDANGTGEVVVPESDVVIENNLDVDGTTQLDQVVVNGTITHTGDYVQTGNSTVNGAVDVQGDISVTGSAQFEDIKIDNNYITTTQSNSDLELRANGTGSVTVPDNNVTFSQSITVQGTANLDNVSTDGTVTANSFSTGDILIDDNYITTTQSNSDLELRANGTGVIRVDDLGFASNVISSDTDIVLDPASGIVEVSGTGSLRVPKGTAVERPGSPVTGMIRYNTDGDLFEGWNGSYWTRLSQGVIDVDGDTRITAELTPGADDDTIRFIVQNNTVADIDNTRLRANKLVIDDLEIDGNVISTATSNTDISLQANGTGSVRFENFSFSGSTITNTVSDSVSLLANSTNGYVKIDGTNGFVLPVGTSTNRPNPAFRETGMIRFNTTDGRVEVFDGTIWTSVAGAQSGITFSDAEDLAFGIVLSLG